MKEKYEGVWRVPPVRTNGFPKLMVDDRVSTGSIEIRGAGLPLWRIVPAVINEGWDEVEKDYTPPEDNGYTKEDLAHFLYCLLEQRGEFGRLLLTLANVEHMNTCWWDKPRYRNMVSKQLQRCLDALNEIEKKETEK